MSYLLNKKDDILIHLIFIFILSLFYLIPYFLVGHLIVTPHDILDTSVVENYIIGRIYGGDTESINLFLAGEIKWYYLTRILQPLSLLYALFETEFAYWLTDILIKLICYLCFFKLSRKLNCSVFNSALIACLIVSSVSPYYSILGLGMATFPYLIYLVIKNKNLNLKHYFIIAFIGLNFALVFHVFIVPILLLVSLIFCSNYQQYNLKLFIKISVVLLFFAFLSNSNLIYAQLFSGPFHRTGYIFEAPDLIVNFTELVREFFSIPVIKGNPYFYQRFLFDLCAFFIIIISLFSKNKKVYFLLLIIFFIAFFNFLLNLESIAVLRNNVGGIFKTISWDFIKFSLLFCMDCYLF